MRLIYLLTFAIALSTLQLAAQTVDYSRIVPPATATARTFGDYLVQRAYLNNASNVALGAEVAIADAEIDRAKLGWLDQLNANINLSSRQDSLQGLFGLGGDQSPTFVGPGFNYGLSFNIGGLVNNGKNVRIARQRKIIAESERDQQKLALRAVVYTRLEEYDNAREVLRIRRQSEIDAESNYTLVRNLFEQNKAQFEDLASASEIYNRSVEATAVAESGVRIARYAIEEIVGEPWSNLLDARARYEAQERR